MHGKLTLSEVERIAQHIETCSRCEQTLQDIQGEDTLAEQVRAEAGRIDKPVEAAVQQLIERMRNRDRFRFDETVGVEPGPAAAADLRFLAPAQTADELGRLGHYRVLKVLGQGGMGMVFLGHDTHLDRAVALKVMLPHIAANESAKQRFLREARAAAKLKSDYIVTIYQVSEDRGIPFLALEYLEGAPLDQFLSGGRKLPVPQILRIAREVARGLADAHERGLIHRDIKPGNIWLDKSHDDRAMILDFGLARAQDDAHVTHSGTIVGTPAYMAPEQARGEKVDGRADLFSLGCVLYKLCVGDIPFKAETTMGVLMALATHHPTPPCQINEQIPRALSDLIMQLLDKDVAKRPASAGEVIERLSAIEKSLGTEPMDIGAAKANAKPAPAPRLQSSKRRPVLLALVPLLFLGLLVWAGSVFYWQTPEGTVQIEINDPKIKLEIEGHTAVISQADSKPIKLQPGKKGLKISRDGFTFDTTSFQLTKGGDTTLKIDWLDGKMLVFQDGKKIDEKAAPIVAESKTALELRKLREQFRAALIKRDWATLEKHLADDFVDTDALGQVYSKKDFLAHVQSPVFVIESIRSEDEKVGVEGDRAVITAKVTVKGKSGDSDFSGTYRDKSEYAKRNGRWQCVTSQRELVRAPDPEVQARPPGIVNLLSLINPAVDSVNGVWRFNDKGELLAGGSHSNERIRIPYRPAQEYDLRVAFTRIEGNDCIMQVLAGAGWQCDLVFGAFNNTVAGLEMVGGHDVQNNASRVVKRLNSGQRYVSLVQVRKDGVKIILDGKPLTQLKTDFSNVRILGDWDMKDKTVLGLGCWRSSTVFHKAEITEIGAAGVLLRPQDPGAKKAFQQRSSALPKRLPNSLGMEFALVPKGKAWLGGGAGKVGAKAVEIKQDFYLGVYEVTQEEWEKVMQKNPSHFARNGNGALAVQEISDNELRRFPVEQVSWHDAQEFIERLNPLVNEPAWIYRLPTEVEWEYACRGGPMSDPVESTWDYYLDIPTNGLRPDQANFKDSGLNRTRKVGSYAPNRLGLYDMHGNVWEWCDDAGPADPKNPTAAPPRFHRGGCWSYGAWHCRTVYRDPIPPSDRGANYGLRLARVPAVSTSP